MTDTKPEFLGTLFEQIETQVQFGDGKASLLVAGDAVLLAVAGGLVSTVSGCPGGNFALGCLVLSLPLGLATVALAFLAASLVLALLAARPAGIHDRPPPELFLLSHIARIDREEFARQYAESSPDAMKEAALNAIHGKAVYATRKFRLLKRAIDATLVSLFFMAAALVFALGKLWLG